MDHCWQSFLRRFGLEHTFRMIKQTLGWTKPRLRSPHAADRWTWLTLVAHTQLRLARPLRSAERLGVNSGTASYHLRQLGAAGFVEEDTERGNARERWWRSVHRTTWFNDPDLAEREPEAALAYLQSVAAIYTLRTQQALNGLQTMPRAWRNTFDMSDWALRLTPEETDSLYRELAEVVARYRRDTPQTAASAPEGAERIAVITQILPELDAPAASQLPSGPQEKEESPAS